MFMRILISSPTAWEASIKAFQLNPKLFLLRLLVTFQCRLSDAPLLSGNNSTWSSTGRVVPCIVKLPCTSAVRSPLRYTDVILHLIGRHLCTSQKFAESI